MHKTEFCLNIYTDGRNTNLIKNKFVSIPAKYVRANELTLIASFGDMIDLNNNIVLGILSPAFNTDVTNDFSISVYQKGDELYIKPSIAQYYSMYFNIMYKSK